MLCSMSTDIKSIETKLNIIKKELEFIKNNMITKEDMLSADEFLAYKRSFNKKNLVPLEKAKKELDL